MAGAGTPDHDAEWLARWIGAVRDGRASMSQRARSSIDAHRGLATAVAVARENGVHLVELTDDKGKRLVAASLHPFTSLC